MTAQPHVKLTRRQGPRAVLPLLKDAVRDLAALRGLHLYGLNNDERQILRQTLQASPVSPPLVRPLDCASGLQLIVAHSS